MNFKVMTRTQTTSEIRIRSDALKLRSGYVEFELKGKQFHVPHNWEDRIRYFKSFTQLAPRFLREDAEESSAKPLSWEEQLAKKYYNNLYREFAVCDLKHYKSGNFALRWRTEEEVLSGSGETTCGNIRCRHHDRAYSDLDLKTLEVPFGYEEQGAYKSCLVKLVLCGRCTKKLLWKREKERERLAGSGSLDADDRAAESERDRKEEEILSPADGRSRGVKEDDHQRARERRDWESEPKRRRHSRSASPRVRKPGNSKRRRSRSR